MTKGKEMALMYIFPYFRVEHLLDMKETAFLNGDG